MGTFSLRFISFHEYTKLSEILLCAFRNPVPFELFFFTFITGKKIQKNREQLT